MIDTLMNIGEILSPIFYKILYMSVVGSVIGIIVFTLMKLFENKLSAKSKCYLWIIPLIFLLMPINRIQINTKKDLPAVAVVDKFETAINNMSYVQSNEKLKDVQIETAKEDIPKEKGYTKKQIISKLVPVVWGGISVLGIISFILGNIRLNIKINMNKRCRDIRIKEILNSCRQKLKINRRIGIKFQDFNLSPCIYGIIHPKVLIPCEFKDKSEETLENIFMHELSHYKRKDMLTNYILLLTITIHWFNPFVHYLFKKIRQDMELATDEIALKQMNKEEKKRYGMTLISLLETYENNRTSLEMLCITDNDKNMERRIKKIKLETKFKKYKKSIVILVITIVMCVLSPFVLKTNSIANNNEDLIKDEEKKDLMEQYLIKKKQESQYIERLEDASNKGENIENYANYANEDRQSFIGEWKPYKAESVMGEINLSNVYGSGIKAYGGSLELRPDGTYTKFIGIYSEEQVSDLVGTYEIIEPSDGQEGRHFLIVLHPKIGEMQVLTYLESDGVIIEKTDLNTEVYYTK